MGKPDHLPLTALTILTGSLLGLVSSGTALLASPRLLTSGLLSWPGFGLPLTLAAFVGSAVGLATVVGLLAMRPWAPKVGSVLGALTSIVGLFTITLLASLKGFVFPAGEILGWTVAIVAGLWVIIWCTRDDVVDAYAEEEVFPSTRPAGAEAEPETSD